MPNVHVSLVMAAVALPVAFGTAAQEPPGVPGPTPDSQRVRASVEAAQAQFEHLRYRHLPVSFGYGSGRCDEQVGRYCYWNDGDDSWKPAAEAPEVVAGRYGLLALLDSAAALLPADPWIVGQRVRYSIEADELSKALTVARLCRAERWWCLALQGYAQHARSEFLESERSFRIALAEMSADRRCGWSDMSLLLQGSAARQYADLDCEARGALEARLWWLADPLYMTPGNERRTEHFTRLVLNEILSRSRTVRRSRWGDDNRELLVRYGHVAGWEQARSRTTTLGSGDHVIGHHSLGGLRLIPTSAVVLDLTTLAPLTWNLEPELPRSEYAPAYTKELRWLEHYVTLFRRSDSAVVVASFLVPQPDSSTQQPSIVRSYIAAAESETAPYFARPGVGSDPLALTIPHRATLLSVEVLSRSDSLAARARYWLDVPGRLDNGTAGFSLSDILLVADRDRLPNTLDAAIPAALPPGDIAEGATVGLFWEMYGIGSATQTATMSLEVEKKGKGLFRKVGEFFGVVGERRDRIEMRWQENLNPMSHVPRAVAIQLTDEMRGDYLITLRIQLDTGETAKSERRIEVNG